MQSPEIKNTLYCFIAIKVKLTDYSTGDGVICVVRTGGLVCLLLNSEANKQIFTSGLKLKNAFSK